MDERVLAQAGVSPILTAALAHRETITTDDEDAEVREALRSLVMRAIDIARCELEWGTPNDRIAIMKILLSRGLRDTGTTTTRSDDMMLLFEEATSAVRNVRPRELLPDVDA
jgi:hypothetical protein